MTKRLEIDAAHDASKALDDLVVANRADLDEWLRLRKVYFDAVKADMAVRRTRWAEEDARLHRQRWWRHPIRTFLEFKRKVFK